MNYIKLFEDATSEAVDVKPSWGMYEKEHALDNREVYIDGNWYSTTGGELVTNGTFDTDVSGWTAYNAIITQENGILKVDDSANAGDASSAYQEITTIAGVEYTIQLNMVSTTNSSYLDIGIATVTWGMLSTPLNIGYNSFTFVATSTVATVHLGTNGTSITYFDNISVFKTEPTIDTLQLPHTYLSNKGKLAGIEVANSIPVNIHYDELAPTLVEDTIKTSNLVVGETADISSLNVTDGFDLGQSWVDVKSERAALVTYTNTTGKPIMVSVAVQTASNVVHLASVDNVMVGFFYDAYDSVKGTGTLTFIVPDASVYKIFNGGNQGAINVWAELR